MYIGINSISNNKYNNMVMVHVYCCKQMIYWSTYTYYNILLYFRQLKK